jgi:exopolysaccharide biosynthesis polyprenyl glycosylphosphotransferase
LGPACGALVPDQASPRVQFRLSHPRWISAPWLSVRDVGRRDTLVRRILGLVDAAAIAMSLALAFWLTSSQRAPIAWGLMTIPAWIILFKLYGLYDRDVKRINHLTVNDIPSLFHALLLGSLLLWLYYKVLAIAQITPANVLVFAVSAMFVVLAARGATRKVIRRALGAERVVFLGEGDMSADLIRKLRAHPEHGLDPVGVIVPSPAGARRSNLPVLGAVDALGELAARHRFGRVIVSETDCDQELVASLIQRCKALSLKVSLLSHLSPALGASVVIDDVGGVTVLDVNPAVLSRSSVFVKRSMDVVISSLLLLAAAPLVVFVAAAIKLEDRGPVIFRQERVGRSGRRFTLFKFRTMVVDAQVHRDELLRDSTDPNWLALKHDPRVTRVGRFLRLTSLDELPQLWNVLRGEMSLVGPRPLIESEDRLVEGWRRGRLDLTPGMTGYWQVLGRTRLPFEEMVKLDYLYVSNWSLWTDIRLMLRTLTVVVSRRGAN